LFIMKKKNFFVLCEKCKYRYAYRHWSVFHNIWASLVIWAYYDTSYSWETRSCTKSIL
jgi:hypothetical protein